MIKGMEYPNRDFSPDSVLKKKRVDDVMLTRKEMIDAINALEGLKRKLKKILNR